MSVIIEVAEAVKTEIESQEYSQNVAVRRAYKPVYELADRETIQVTVIPAGVEISRVARGGDQYDVHIEVGIQKKFTNGDNDELDPLMTLVEEITDLFRRKRFFGSPVGVSMGVDNPHVFAPEHIDKKRMFTSVLSLTFRLIR
mgnify:CR=1 FL=1